MGKDKFYHFFGGCLLYLLGGFWLVVIAGAGKEVYDYFNRDKHTPELLDFVFTLAGGWLMYIVQTV